jgi:glutamate-1-semialdehyde 2,1-aminomutase
VKAGSGVATLNIQTVPGVTAGVAENTLTAPYNNLSAVEKLIEDNKGEVAAIILEPVVGNMGCVPPQEGFLEGLRKLCNEENIILIFDEVMTGFRLAGGGAQEKFKVDADLVTYGKVIGGGLPVGAFGGKKEIMEHIAPLGNVYQAGTLSGNPIAMIAGYTMLKELKNNPSIYNELDQKSARLEKSLNDILAGKNIPHRINRVGSMVSIFFTNDEVTDFETASKTDIKLFNNFFHHLLDHGIYLPPSAFESWFVSNAVTSEEIQKTLDAVEDFKG